MLTINRGRKYIRHSNRGTRFFRVTSWRVDKLTCCLIDKKINQLIENKSYNLFTYQLVYSSTKNLLTKNLFLCYSVLTYPVYKQLIYMSTCYSKELCSYVTMSTITLSTSNSSTTSLGKRGWRLWCYWAPQWGTYVTPTSP